MERNNSQSSGYSGTTVPSTSLSAPDIPVQQAHVRMPLSHYRSLFPQLLDIILARDCLLFCPINRNDFKRDLESGNGTHCTPALLDSLLALGTVLAKDHLNLLATTASGRPDEESLGDTFAQEAIAVLYNDTVLPQRIADIQALGILSLYCLRRKRLIDGKGFAGDFGASIIKQCCIEQPKDLGPPFLQNKQEYASIYCAAISLNRYAANCS